MTNENVTLPLLPLTSGVVLPGMVFTMALESDEARAAVESARSAGSRLLLVPHIEGRFASPVLPGDALTVSMFALIPGLHLGWPALVAAVLGEIFVFASLLSLYRLREEQPGQYRESLFLIGIAIVFGFQLMAGIELINHPESVGDVRTLAILVVVCALGGIARSWELIGGPQIGLRREVVTSVRRHSHEDDAPRDN